MIDDDENDKLILVMEFMTATLSNKTLPLQENELRSYARDLLLSVDYCSF